eukprot:SM006285S20099  [mRNA]  locus=s6285:64:873:- [translate_table: standard]
MLARLSWLSGPPRLWAPPYRLLALLIASIFIPVDPDFGPGLRLARFIVDNAKDHFPVSVVVEEDAQLDADKTYVIGLEPHSVLPLGCLAFNRIAPLVPLRNCDSSPPSFLPPLRRLPLQVAMQTGPPLSPLRRLRALVAVAGGMLQLDWVPIVRHVWTWLGLSPVSKRAFAELLRRHISCVVIPGGVTECLVMNPDTE